jgi:hypothetical protein
VPTTKEVLLTTPAGDYQPLPYAAPGIVLQLAHGPIWGDRLGRLASLIPVIAAVALALALLCGGYAPIALVAVFLSLAPMALFLGSSLSPSGLEIACGFAFAALLLRMTRDEPTPHQWLLFAIVGSTLALTRTTGAVWVVLDCAIASVLAGRSTLTRLVRVRGAKPALATVGGAVVLNRVWELTYGSTVTQAGTDSPSLLQWVPHGVGQLRRIFNECVGVFGWLDAVMSPWMYRFWSILAVVILAAGFILGSRRQRAALALAVAADAAVVSLLSASLEASTGADIQGRHVLPFLILTPLIAADVVVHRLRSERIAAIVLGCCGSIAAATQWIAFMTNGRRQSIGTSRPWFDILSSPAWSPRLGWGCSIALATRGCVPLACRRHGRTGGHDWGLRASGR